jgi:hypothetical protein
MPLLAELSAGTILILIVLVALPIGAVVFATGAGKAFDQVGKGDLSIEQQDQGGGSGGGEMPVSAAVREEEVRQMVQARSDRAVDRGSDPIDVDAEVERLLAPEPGGLGNDPALREEVRTLVVAKNERRARQGKKQLDVDAEVERQLRELENLGQ